MPSHLALSASIAFLTLPALALFSGCSTSPNRAGDPQHAEFRSLTIVDEQGNARIELGCGKSRGATSIVLRDSSGQERVVLALQEDGSPRIAILGESGQEEILIEAGKDFSRLQLKSLQGKASIKLEARGPNDVSLVLQDGIERKRVALQLQGDGSGSMRFFDEEQKTRLFAGNADPKDREFVFAADSDDGKSRACIGSSAISTAYVAIAGRESWRAALMFDEARLPTLRLADSSGISRFVARIGENSECQLGICGGDGKPGILARCPRSGFADLMLCDASKASRLYLGKLENDDLGIGVFADEKSPRSLLGLTDGGRPYLWLRDNVGPMACISSDGKGRSCLEIYEKRKRRLFLGFDDAGESTIQTIDSEGRSTWKSK